MLETKVNYVIHRQTYKGWEIAERTISDHELVFVIGGAGEITINNSRYSVGANQMLYFSPKLRHSLKTDENNLMEFYGVHFDCSMDKMPLLNISPLKIQLGALLSELAEVYTKKPYEHDWKENILLQSILYEIFFAKDNDIQPTNVIRINKVLEHIHNNPCEKHTVEELRNIAGLKKTYFIDAFKQITRTTPIKYVVNLRLQYSKDLLIETDLKIYEIAHRCGFDDELYYSRCFKKHFGMSPARYRLER